MHHIASKCNVWLHCKFRSNRLCLSTPNWRWNMCLWTWIKCKNIVDLRLTIFLGNYDYNIISKDVTVQLYIKYILSQFCIAVHQVFFILRLWTAWMDHEIVTPKENSKQRLKDTIRHICLKLFSTDFIFRFEIYLVVYLS